LAAALTPEDETPPTPAALLADALDLFVERPDGAALLAAAERSDRAATRQAVAAFAGEPNFPPRLAHHLALVETRSALSLEDRGRTADAVPLWHSAWRFWLSFLAAEEPARGPLLDHLLTASRRRVADLLARGAVDDARRHWLVVRDLPSIAAGSNESLGRDLADRVEGFRDELATEHLLSTREAMRYGAVAEGFRADHEGGLAGLRRLLSLDADNPRLLTALVEICGEYYFDLYNVGDFRRLAEQVDRFTPFAVKLAASTDRRPNDLAARAALGDFFKFRGFVCGDRDRKIALYRDALRFDPGNDNVRKLLADLGEDKDEGGGMKDEPEPS
jgi:hypothetical protein